MFCLKEHYILFGNFHTYLRKSRQPVYSFGISARTDRKVRTISVQYILDSHILCDPKVNLKCVCSDADY